MKGSWLQRRATAAAALAAAFAAAGCSEQRSSAARVVGDTEFSVLGPSEPEDAPPPAILEEVRQRPVSRVSTLELGVMHRARLLSASGEAPRTGWFQPALRPRRDGAPAPDGFLEFDLVAAPPELNGGQQTPAGAPAQRRIKAVRPIPEDEARRAAGVRVFAAEGPPAALRFAAPSPDETAPARRRGAVPAGPVQGPGLGG